MKQTILFLLCLMSFLSGQAQNVIDLSGEWQFQIDRENKGESEG